MFIFQQNTRQIIHAQKITVRQNKQQGEMKIVQDQLFKIQMNDDVPNGQSLIRLDQKQIQVLKQRLKQFKEIFDQQQAKFLKSDEVDYYIVSRQYINDWLEYCQADDNQRKQLQDLNTDIIDQHGQLRPGLVQAQDFEIVNQNIYKLIKPEKGMQIRRRSVIVNNQKRVPIYLSTIKYLKLNHNDIKGIDLKHIGLKDLTIKTVQFPMIDSIGNLIETIKWNENSKLKKVRLWKNNSDDVSIEKLYNYIRDKTRFMMTVYRLDGVGKLIQDQKTKLTDLNLEDKDYFIAEFCQDSYTYFFKSSDEAKCESCYKYKKLSFVCGCKKVAYCTEECKEKDKKFHIKNCKFAEEQEMKQEILMVITPTSSLGIVGLSNLGNTCFMNSCLQCLSNTTLLTQYFLNRYYENEINYDNPLGSQGRLAKNYAKFIKGMWCSSQSTFSPSSLKSAVAKLNPIFSGYAQHDSQQFFSFLADGIHEDLNRVKKKPYVESMDSKGRPDHVVAFESWVGHTQRNQSIIVDLMTGQYKSKVVCPVCSLQSITFDPFTTVSLPIPEEEVTGTLKFFVIFNNSQQQALRTSIQYKKGNGKEWLESATKALNRPTHDFVFYVLSVFQNVYNFQTTSKTEILHKIQSQSKHAFLLELDPSERQLKQKVQIITKFCKKSTYYEKEFDNLWFKRPFFFEKETTTLLNVSQRFTRFLYKLYVKKIPFEEYQSRMHTQKPFTLVLKYNKKLQRTYGKVETSFNNEFQLTINKDRLADIIEKYKDCELDVRFTKESVKLFEFEKLKSFKDIMPQKSNRKLSSKDTSVTLDQCFNVFQQKQQLDHGNQWYCPKCKEHRLATKQMTIYKAPEILILHLKRFKNKGIVRKEKNQTNVIFPTVLNMRKYLIDPEPMSSYIPELIKQNKYIQPSFKANHSIEECEPEYDLYAISNHYGGLGGGHYTAFAKNKQKWFEFNDSSVRSASQESIKGSAAYMLFYRRRNSLKIT